MGNRKGQEGRERDGGAECEFRYLLNLTCSTANARSTATEIRRELLV